MFKKLLERPVVLRSFFETFLPEVWRFADFSEFRYADIDGKQYDYAGFAKLVTEVFAGLSAQKPTMRSQEILVLGPDTVLVIGLRPDGGVSRAETDHELAGNGCP